MQCMECHERPAALHVTEIVNGTKRERHLCEQCAQKKVMLQIKKKDILYMI